MEGREGGRQERKERREKEAKILKEYCSVAKLLRLCNPMDCRTPGTSVLHYLLEFAQIMSIESVIISNHVILCHPLLLLPSIFPSIRVLSNETALCIRWPKNWSFSFSISLSNEYSGLISFRIAWFDLLAVQGTLKSLLYHSSALNLLYGLTLISVHD